MTTRAEDNPFPSILIEEQTEPTAPAAGHQRLYIDSTTHKLKATNSSGTDRTLEGGSVATDTIFDAKGDLAAGTGADTAAKLTVGANDTILMADSGQSTGLKWVASQTPSTQNYSDSATEGTADTYARGDHKHGMPAAGGVTFHGCQGNAASAALSNGSYTSIACGSADSYDTDAYHDTSTNNTRFTVPTGLGGKYLFLVTLFFDYGGSSTTDKRIAYRVNGGTDNIIFRDYLASTTSSVSAIFSGSVVVALAQADYIEARGFVDAASVNYRAQISLAYLGA